MILYYRELLLVSENPKIRFQQRQVYIKLHDKGIFQLLQRTDPVKPIYFFPAFTG